jgi:hypothetical protein
MEQTDAIQQVAPAPGKKLKKKEMKAEAEAEAEAEMAEMREMMKQMKMENEALRKEKEQALLATKKASKSWIIMEQWIKETETHLEHKEAGVAEKIKQMEDAMTEERNKFELQKEEMGRLMDEGSEAEMDAWVGEHATTRKLVTAQAGGGAVKGGRTNKNRDGCLDILMNGMTLRASGTIRGTGETTSLEIVYDKRTKSFYGKTTRKDYLKLQDANREWCEARGLPKLGNAWEDFKAVSKDGVVKSIEHIWKEEGNWIKDANEEDWVY